MRHALVLVLVLVLAACGRREDDGEVHANVSLTQGLAMSDIQSLELTVAESTSSTGSTFSCSKLGSDWIIERDDAQIHYHRLLTPGATKVTDIAKGASLVVVLDGYSTANGLGDRIAHGCLDGVTITGGQTKAISIVLSPLK